MPKPRCRTPVIPNFALIAAAFVLASCHSTAWAQRTLNWSGHDWIVRSSGGEPSGPGPNIFSSDTDSVFVDQAGDLHLKIRQRRDDRWTAAEVRLAKSLSFGTYRWQVSTRYDELATNVVVGLFTYLSPASVQRQTGGKVGNAKPDTPHEIDIEMTGVWGPSNLYYTTHDPDIKSPGTSFSKPLTSRFTTHQFTWKPDAIEWKSFQGHVDDATIESAKTLAEYTYTGEVVPEDLNEVPIINFWLFGDTPSMSGPSDGKPQELVIHDFDYKPVK